VDSGRVNDEQTSSVLLTESVWPSSAVPSLWTADGLPTDRGIIIESHTLPRRPHTTTSSSCMHAVPATSTASRSSLNHKVIYPPTFSDPNHPISHGTTPTPPYNTHPRRVTGRECDAQPIPIAMIVDTIHPTGDIIF
jgi:hypothetical protein